MKNKIKVKATGEETFCNLIFSCEDGLFVPHYYKNLEKAEGEEWLKDEIEFPNEKLPLPFELFGVECGPGWNELIAPLFDYIQKYNEGKDEEEQIVITQIKEKFGGLRFYTNFVTDELDKMIDKAEEESYNVCETCGTRKDVGETIDGWYETICHECLKKNVESQAKHHPKGFRRVWRKNSDGKAYYIFPDKDDEEAKGL